RRTDHGMVKQPHEPGLPTMPDQQHHDDFLKFVGVCIASWAVIEEILFQVCWSALKVTEERAAIVFDRTPTLSGRLDLTDELVKTILPKAGVGIGAHDHADVQRWNKLCGDIRKLASIRNQIAHRPVASRLSFRPDGLPDLGTTRWLELFQSNTKR